MELYSNNEYYKLYKWNMLDLWEVIEPCSIDAILTDPPYELNFMWKGWDNSWIAFQPDTWKRCLDALKPWWYLLAFGGSRTYHRIACAIEDAGFEIRDCIMWLYGSWFPKSMNIWLAIDKKNWVDNRTWRIVHHAQKWVAVAETRWAIGWWAFGEARDVEERKATNERAWWGTALKPSYEPIIVARKPLEWSCTDNVIKYWVGGINIDECRVWTDEVITNHSRSSESAISKWIYGNSEWQETHQTEWQALGRFPANTILTYDESDFEEVCGGFPDTKSWSKLVRNADVNRNEDPTNWSAFNGYRCWHKKDWISNYGDEWSAARYFYCAKASRRDRDEGLQEFETKTKVFNWQSDKPSTEMKDVEKRFTTQWKNTHPTVKPCDLMQYLVRLVTPNGWTVLDPFNWSGSTWKAVMYENKDRNKNYKYIWIELTEEYLPIAKARIEYVINKGIEKEKSDPKQEEQTKQRKESALF